MYFNVNVNSNWFSSGVNGCFCEINITSIVETFSVSYIQSTRLPIIYECDKIDDIFLVSQYAGTIYYHVNVPDTPARQVKYL